MTDVGQQRAQQLAEALWNDRELGAAVQRKAKELFPDAKTNADVVDPWLAPLRDENEKLAKKLEKIEAERAEERRAAEERSTKQTLEQQLDAARKAFNLTDEGFDKMVERMKSTGNYSDAEAAAAWVAKQNPPAPPPGPTWGPRNLDLWGTKNRDESLALLHKDPMAFADREFSTFVNDPDAYVRDTFRAA